MFTKQFHIFHVGYTCFEIKIGAGDEQDHTVFTYFYVKKKKVEGMLLLLDPLHDLILDVQLVS